MLKVTGFERFDWRGYIEQRACDQTVSGKSAHVICRRASDIHSHATQQDSRLIKNISLLMPLTAVFRHIYVSCNKNTQIRLNIGLQPLEAMRFGGWMGCQRNVGAVLSRIVRPESSRRDYAVREPAEEPSASHAL